MTSFTFSPLYPRGKSLVRVLGQSSIVDVDVMTLPGIEPPSSSSHLGVFTDCCLATYKTAAGLITILMNHHIFSLSLGSDINDLHYFIRCMHKSCGVRFMNGI
jgi:hypothetical protein